MIADYRAAGIGAIAGPFGDFRNDKAYLKRAERLVQLADDSAYQACHAGRPLAARQLPGVETAATTAGPSRAVRSACDSGPRHAWTRPSTSPSRTCQIHCPPIESNYSCPWPTSRPGSSDGVLAACGVQLNYQNHVQSNPLF